MELLAHRRRPGAAQAAARVSGGRPRGRAERGVITLSFFLFESLAMARPPSAAAPPAGWLVLAALRAASREPKQRLNA